LASLIPDFGYGIFISYSQKDIKGERWVSEFVDALKTPSLPAGILPTGNFVMIL
jgi:hypothetical protein